MKKKVLIVDDSQAILHLFTKFFTQQGFEVATAGDGLAALDVLESFRPDIMFVDRIMPKIHGDKLCRIVRKMPEFDAVSLVIVSAAAMEEKIDLASLGADACIAKGPLQQMLESVSQVLLHLQNNETGPLQSRIFGSENIFARDITRELLDHKKHLDITLDNLDDGLIELTGEGKITLVNRAATKLLDMPEENLLSSYFADIFNSSQRQLMHEILNRQDSSIVRIGEDVPVIHNGNYLLIKFVPFRDRDCRHFIIMVQDITLRKKAELELKRHEEELDQLVQQRTAALEDANHELRVLLCKVKLLSGMLPICASCKKIRDDEGYWNQIEEYIETHSEAEFTHSICEECAAKLYPDFTFKKQDNL